MAYGTQQHKKQSTTVRDLVRRARGPQPERAERIDHAAAYFGNFPEKIDLQECLNIQRRVQEQFDVLPAQVKVRFGYNPVNLIEFVSKDENYEEARKLGLISIEAQKRREEAAKAAKRAERDKIAQEVAAELAQGNSKSQGNV